MNLKIFWTKVLNAYGVLAPALLFAAAVASLRVALKSDEAIKYLGCSIRWFEEDNLRYDWRCSVDMSNAIWPSRILSGTFIATSLLCSVLAVSMVLVRKSNHRMSQFLRVLFWIACSAFAQSVYFIVVDKVLRPRFYFNPSLLDPHDDMPLDSKSALYYQMRNLDQRYRDFSAVDHTLLASWIAVGLLVPAIASAFVNLRDKGIQLPVTSNDIDDSVERQGGDQ